uniref:Uncharacterized protein n=1 Tax=Nicotiana tabacum TaxID=4097 RepID=A0A1S4DHB2_TOBAC|nr:PREDICTED: uncharacterized protein LOC107829781 [Nicotiana tabacum]
MSDKIKEEIMKQLSENVIKVVRYSTWFANVVPVLKKDGKIRVCVDCRELNKARPKDNFPLPNIHILVDNHAKHEIQYFVDCYAGSRCQLADWQNGNSCSQSFDIVYVTHTTMKAQALADYLAENLAVDEYESLNTYFPYEEVNLVKDVVQDDCQIWKLYIDGAVNIKGIEIGAILVSPSGQH